MKKRKHETLGLEITDSKKVSNAKRVVDPEKKRKLQKRCWDKKWEHRRGVEVDIFEWDDFGWELNNQAQYYFCNLVKDIGPYKKGHYFQSIIVDYQSGEYRMYEGYTRDEPTFVLPIKVVVDTEKLNERENEVIALDEEEITEVDSAPENVEE